MRVPRSPRLLGLVAATVLGATGLGALTACGETSAPSRALDVEVALTSRYKRLHTVGPENSIVYGWNDLEGTTEIDGEEVAVEMLGHVEYVNGGGAFGGPVTLTFPDGSTLAFAQVQAIATAKTDTSDARFRGLLRIIGGTGRFVDARGRGTLEGRRNDSLGGTVEMRFRLQVVG